MRLWISTPTVAGEIEVENGIIVAASPIWRRFIGQSRNRLVFWLYNFWGNEVVVKRIG